MPDGHPAEVARAVRAFVIAASAATVACALTLTRFPLRLGLTPSIAAALGLVLLLAVFNKYAIRVTIRGERIAMSMQESILVGTLVLLSPAVAPLVAGVGTALGQLWCRRAPLKATFNVAQETLATSVAAAAAMGVLTLGAPLVAALLVAPATYALLSHVSVAAILSRVEKLPIRTIFGQRMLKLALVTALLGEATGLAVAMAL